MAIFRLSVHHYLTAGMRLLIPRKNIGGKLLLKRGCVKWMFMEARTEGFIHSIC